MKLFIFALVGGVLLVGVDAHATPVQPKRADSSGSSAILYGRNFSYAVDEPKGWVLDSEAGKSQDLSVVFYKRGQSWQEGDAVIYINLNPHRKGVSLEREAKEDVAAFQKREPDLNIVPSAPLQTHDGRRALTYTFTHQSGEPPFEKTAYIQMPTITQTVVLTAKTRASYQAALGQFNFIVRSLSFLTDKVIIKK